MQPEVLSSEPRVQRAFADPTAESPLARAVLMAVSFTFLALVLIVNYLGGKYYQRWDWTSSNIYSLSEKTESIVAGLDRDVRATILLRPG